MITKCHTLLTPVPNRATHVSGKARKTLEHTSYQNQSGSKRTRARSSRVCRSSDIVQCAHHLLFPAQFFSRFTRREKCVVYKMSNLKLDLVTIQLPLDVRIDEFKSDDDKMKDVNDFINEIVEKAKVEVENRKEAEGKAGLVNSISHI